MTKRVLAIGVGGSGKAALTVLKERLIETYGKVPDNVVLLSFDTDDLRPEDTFAGVRLSPDFDDRGREPEYRPTISQASVTIDQVFADLRGGRTAAYMNWLEDDRLDRILGPTERDIRGGAQQRRPIGRIALFQNWNNPIASSIRDAMERVYGQPEINQADITKEDKEKSKRMVFILGSVSGGTGSGFMIDVINIVRHIVKSNSNWQSVDVAAIIPLPNAFAAFSKGLSQETVGNIKPNAYAALREMDRFIRTHGSSLPYMIRYGNNLESITWGVNQPLDHVYFVDTAVPGGLGKFNLEGDPKQGVFPAMADFIMAHVDAGLGDSLATLRSNAGQHYDKIEGWMYSSFNVQTYILPINDIIDSFSYRFLRELLMKMFLPIKNDKRRYRVEQDALNHVMATFSENSVGDQALPEIIPKAIAVTRPMDPEQPDASWPGLFNMMALSEGTFAKDYQDFQDWLANISERLSPSKEGEYKSEDYEEGYTRLQNDSTYYLDELLGKQQDPLNENSRFGGQWDAILEPYKGEMRQRFSEALDEAILQALNLRDPKSKQLLPHRLPFTQAMLDALKSKLVDFKIELEKAYKEYDIDTRLRQNAEELRNAIAWMYEAKTTSIFGKPEAFKAQEAYIGLFVEKMELILHQRIYGTVMDVLDSLGAAELDGDGVRSILDTAILELDNWRATFQEVDKILDKKWRQLKKYRQEKGQIRVRKYLTDTEFEEALYKKPEHVGRAGIRVMGQLGGEKGINWERTNETKPLNYKMVTIWSNEARGAEQIAQQFFAGAKDVFQIVREHVNVADRIATEFKSAQRFVSIAGEVDAPFLRYNPAANANPQLINERYVAFKQEKAEEAAQVFLTDAAGTLKNNGFNVVDAAESDVACTIVEITRGVRLNAVEQFNACEAPYRNKIYQGRESLHVFPEEQLATRYENRIEVLGEPNNTRRTLAPEVVIGMGDEAKLRLFTLACAYGVIQYTDFKDSRSHATNKEICLLLTPKGQASQPWSEREHHKMRLSKRDELETLDNSFAHVEESEKRARLFLNAFQSFSLIATQKFGVPEYMETNLVNQLAQRGVDLSDIENPFRLKLDTVEVEIEAVREEIKAMGREPVDVLYEFVNDSVAQFKNSPAPRVKDLGTVMHLILRDKIQQGG